MSRAPSRESLSRELFAINQRNSAFTQLKANSDQGTTSEPAFQQRARRVEEAEAKVPMGKSSNKVTGNNLKENRNEGMANESRAQAELTEAENDIVEYQMKVVRREWVKIFAASDG